MRHVSSPTRTRLDDVSSGGPSVTTAHLTGRPTLFQRWFGQGSSSATWTDAELPSPPSAGDPPEPQIPPAVDPTTAPSRYLESVREICARLAATHEPAEFLPRIAEQTRVALRADEVTIRLLAGDQLPVVASAGVNEDPAARLPLTRLDEGPIGEVLRTGWPIAERDLIAPLLRDGKAIGVLAATSREPRDWTAHDVTFVRTVAAHASIALLNGELVEQAAARAAQLAVLQAASARMSRENSVEQVGRAVVEETRSIIDYHNARVYLVEPLGDVVPIAFEGVVGTYDDVDFELLRCKMGEGFTGWVAQHGEPLLVNDANADPRGVSIAGNRRRRRIDARRPDALRPDGRRRDHALQARAGPVRPRGPCGCCRSSPTRRRPRSNPRDCSPARRTSPASSAGCST